MNLLSRFNTAACLTVALGIAAYCAAEESLSLGILAIPACLAGWWTARGSRSLMLPRGMVNLLVLIAIVHAAMRATPFSPDNPLVSVLTEFLVYIQLVKLFDRRTARDDGQLLGLSLFIVIGAVLSSNALSLGLVLLAYTPLAAASAMLLQLTLADPRVPSAEANAADSLDFAGPGTPAVGRASTRQFATVTVCAVAFSMLGAAVIFLTAPRGLGERVFGRFGVAGGGVAVAFTDSVRLGQAGRLSESPRVVADVALSDTRGHPIGSPTRPIHLRGATLDMYTGNGLWARSPRHGDDETHDLDSAFASFTVGPKDESAARLVQQVTLRNPPAIEGHLFAILTPVRVWTERPMRVSFSHSDSTLKHSGAGSGRLRYTIESSEVAQPIGAEPGQGPARWSPANEPVLGFQRGPIRVAAEEVLRNARIPLPLDRDEPGEVRRAASALQDHLRANFGYTTELTAPIEGEDPIEAFLFRLKQGHCEYFASAMAAMCQSVGIQARVVTGYFCSEFNSVTGHYVVRESDAHAWVEVRMGGDRWATFDPSPPASIEELRRRAGGLLTALRRWWDAMEVNWAQSFIGFDSGRQARLFGDRARSGSAASTPSLLRRLDRAWASVRGGLESLGRARGWMDVVVRAAIAGAVAGLLAWLAGKAWQRFRSRTARLRTGIRFYDEALVMLARAGVPKPHHLPPLAHARRLRDARPETAELLERIAARFYDLRYGGAEADGTKAAEGAAAAASLRAALHTP